MPPKKTPPASSLRRSGSAWLSSPLWILAGAFGVGFLAAGTITWAPRPREGGGDGPRRAPTAAELQVFEAHMDRAAREFTAERYPLALQALASAAELNPRHPVPHHALGEVYEKYAMKEAAAACHRRARDADPNYWPAAESLINALYDLGRHEEALAVVDRALAKWPGEPFLWAERAHNLLRLGKGAEAVPLLERYNAVKGRQAWGYTHLARAQDEAGQAEAAERGYREALTIDPLFSMAHFWLGQLLITRGKKAEAERVLAAYQKLRDLETREQQLARTLLGKPDDVNLIVNLANARFQLGKRREALTGLRRALELAPGDEKLRRLHENVRREVEGGTAK